MSLNTYHYAALRSQCAKFTLLLDNIGNAFNLRLILRTNLISRFCSQHCFVEFTKCTTKERKQNPRDGEKVFKCFLKEHEREVLKSRKNRNSGLVE